MWRRNMILMAIGVTVVLLAAPVFAYEAFYGPTELLQYQPDKAYQGYTLFTPLVGKAGEFSTYLINMAGEVVHKYTVPDEPGLYSFLLPDGTFLHGTSPQASQDADIYGVLSAGGAGGQLNVLSWEGAPIWYYPAYSPDYRQHHDFRKIWNNKLNKYTYIMIMWERKSQQDAVNLGTNTAYLSASRNGWSPCAIWEVDPDTNTVIWRWCFSDHIVQNFDPTKTKNFVDVKGWGNSRPTYGNPPDFPGKLDVNWGMTARERGPRVDWTHCNSLDYNQELDHIVINAKAFSEFFVIDHGQTFVSTTDPNLNWAAAASPDGDFVYRFGNPCVYSRNPGTWENVADCPQYQNNGKQQMSGSHDIQWISTGAYFPGANLPGAGNFLIFDNGCYNAVTQASTILEINPYVSGRASDGSLIVGDDYVDPPKAGYLGPRSNQVVWYFTAKLPNDFYSWHISGAQRLPNGNTVICSGHAGHLFEVTPTKEVVWEYVNPSSGGAIYEAQSSTDRSAFNVFRCYRYGPDYPGLKGKMLTSQGTLTGRASIAATTPTSGWGFGFAGSGGAGGGGGGAGGAGGAGGGAGGY